MRIAILQAAGKGQRIAGFTQGAVPKQLLPLHHGAVIDYALEACRIADCTPHIVVPEGDSRIAEYAHSRSFQLPVFCYSRGSQVYDTSSLHGLYNGAYVAYVMPDTVFKPATALATLFDFLETQCYICAAGLFQTATPRKFGMCAVDQQGLITEVLDKPSSWHEEDGLAWGLIAWRGWAWNMIHETASAGDTHFSAVLNRVIHKIGPIPYFVLDDYMDIATEQDYRQALEDGW